MTSPPSSPPLLDDQPSRPSTPPHGASDRSVHSLSASGYSDGDLEVHSESKIEVLPNVHKTSSTQSSPPSLSPPATSSPQLLPSSTSSLTMTDKGKGKVAAKTNHFAPPLDLPPAFGARGKLDPHSTVFTPLRPLDSSTVFGGLNHRDKVNESVIDNPPMTNNCSSHRASHSRHSLSSSASTSISSPASQFSFTPTTPSSAQTWAATSPFSSTSATVHTPHSSTSDLIGRSAFDHHNNKAELGQDELGRFLLIHNVPATGTGEQLRQVIQGIAPYKAIIVKHLRLKGWIIVAFYDSRSAKKVSDTLSAGQVHFGDEMFQLQCADISPEAVRQIAGTADDWKHVWRASESVIKVDVQSIHGFAADGMQKCLATFGELRYFEAHDTAGKSFVADFWDTRHAADAIRVLHGQPVESGTVSVRYLSEDPFQSVPVGNLRQQSPYSYTLGSAAYGSTTPASSYATSPSPRSIGPLSPPGAASPTSHNNLLAGFKGLSLQSEVFESPSRHWRASSGPSELDGSGFYSGQDNHTPTSYQMSESSALQGILNHIDVTSRARHQRPLLGPQWNHGLDRQAIPPENRVFPERITAGLDTRTTVMVKDVPNKLSRQELVSILGDVVPGGFDFVYLRFDFNNHCNYGYAFVNFTSCQALLAFIHARVGKKWNMFSSEKVLQVSYGNIQGKAALINKFRNSAVMDVNEEWRPQIFYSNGAHKGKPEPFPEADNPAMRHRSTSARLSFLSGNPDHERGDYDYSGSSPFNF